MNIFEKRFLELTASFFSFIKAPPLFYYYPMQVLCCPELDNVYFRMFISSDNVSSRNSADVVDLEPFCKVRNVM